MKINKNFAEIITQIRNDNLEGRSHSRDVVHWEEDHRLRSGAAKAIVFILPTRGCSWALSNSGGCSICGYLYDNPQHPDFEKIVKSIRGAFKGKIQKDEKYSIKLFTSGSFLDKKEIPIEFQVEILKEMAIYNQIEEIVIESRPEYIRSNTLEILSEVINISKLEIAIGLESSNNEILKNSINKGFFAIRLIAWKAELNLSTWPTWKTNLFLFANASRLFASLTVMVIGFSTNKWRFF